MSRPDHLIVTAHHEAAHAVINYRAAGFAGGPVSIVPTAGLLGSSADHVSDSSNADDMAARVLSCYAGGHAQRLLDPALGDEGCEVDDRLAGDVLSQLGWVEREQEFRDRSLEMVRNHCVEIDAVAAELLAHRVLDATEVELIAAAAGGDPDSDVEAYRADFRSRLDAWRAMMIARARRPGELARRLRNAAGRIQRD